MSEESRRRISCSTTATRSALTRLENITGEISSAIDSRLTRWHGTPKSSGKLYASNNIHMELINQKKARAVALLDRRDAIKYTIDREQVNIDNDLTKLSKINGKYEYASSLNPPAASLPA